MSTEENIQKQRTNDQQVQVDHVKPIVENSTAQSSIYSPQNVQQILKQQEEGLDIFLEQAQNQFREMTKIFFKETKQNWELENAMEEYNRKIKLLINNYQSAVELRPVLLHSFEKLKSVLSTQEKIQQKLDFCEYDTFFYMLRKNPKYLVRLSQRVKGIKNIDEFLSTMFSLFTTEDDESEEIILLNLFDEALKVECGDCKQIGEFMRSNTIFTKMLNYLLKRNPYRTFIIDLLKEPVQTIINSNLDLEINPSVIYKQIIDEAEKRGEKLDLPETVGLEAAMENEQVQEIMKPRFQQIENYSSLVLETIYSSLDKTPYGIRFICKKIYEYAKENFQNATEDELLSLVGGFIFLRFINPSITIADSPTMSIVDRQLSKKERKNLTLICKVLQNMSNGVAFGAKEKYTQPLNSFLTANQKRLYQYFKDLCQVDDLKIKLEMNIYTELSRGNKEINITYNNVALMHSLCSEHLEHISESNELFYNIVNKLNSMHAPLKKVNKKEDYGFHLKLKNPEKEMMEQKLLNECEMNKDEIIIRRLANMLRELPTIPSIKDQFVTLMDIFKAGKIHAEEKKDHLFANRINQEIEYLLRREEKDKRIEDENGTYEPIMKEIYMQTINRPKIKMEMEMKISKLENIIEETKKRHLYLQDQMEKYKLYLEDVLSKLFKCKGRNKRVGPFVFKYNQLDKYGIITSTSYPMNMQKNLKLSFVSHEPGLIKLLLKAPKVSEELLLDFNDLLEKQYNGVRELEFQKMTFDLSLMIYLLDSLFLLSKGKIKKIKKRRKFTCMPN